MQFIALFTTAVYSTIYNRNLQQYLQPCSLPSGPPPPPPPLPAPHRTTRVSDDCACEPEAEVGSVTVTFPSQPNATELEGQCGVDGLPAPRDAQLHSLLLRPQRGGNGQRALKHRVGLACIKVVRLQRPHQQQQQLSTARAPKHKVGLACVKVVRLQRPLQQQQLSTPRALKHKVGLACVKAVRLQRPLQQLSSARALKHKVGLACIKQSGHSHHINNNNCPPRSLHTHGPGVVNDHKNAKLQAPNVTNKNLF